VHGVSRDNRDAWQRWPAQAPRLVAPGSDSSSTAVYSGSSSTGPQTAAQIRDSAPQASQRPHATRNQATSQPAATPVLDYTNDHATTAAAAAVGRSTTGSMARAPQSADALDLRSGSHALAVRPTNAAPYDANTIALRPSSSDARTHPSSSYMGDLVATAAVSHTRSTEAEFTTDLTNPDVSVPLYLPVARSTAVRRDIMDSPASSVASVDSPPFLSFAAGPLTGSDDDHVLAASRALYPVFMRQNPDVDHAGAPQSAEDPSDSAPDVGVRIVYNRPTTAAEEMDFEPASDRPSDLLTGLGTGHAVDRLHAPSRPGSREWLPSDHHPASPLAEAEAHGRSLASGPNLDSVDSDRAANEYQSNHFGTHTVPSAVAVISPRKASPAPPLISAAAVQAVLQQRMESALFADYLSPRPQLLSDTVAPSRDARHADDSVNAADAVPRAETVILEAPTDDP